MPETVPPAPPLAMFPEIIRVKLSQLRHAILCYFAIGGMIDTLIFIQLIAWLDFAVDRFFEPTPAGRLLLLFLLALATASAIRLRLFKPLSHPLRDDQLAVLLERKFPIFGESLLTTVDLGRRIPNLPSRKFHEETDAPSHDFLLERTIQHAVQTIRLIDIRALPSYRRLGFRFLTASVLTISTLFLLNAHAESFSIWFSRNLLLRNLSWPRGTRMLIEGFDASGKARIAKGDAFTLLVHVDTTARIVPESVTLHLLSADSENKLHPSPPSWFPSRVSSRSLRLDTFRIDTIDGIDYRTFTHVFPEMIDHVSLRISGGDAVLDDYRIEVVPPPMLASLSMHLVYPGYLGLTDMTSPQFSGRAVVPVGSGIRLNAVSSKPLQKITVSEISQGVASARTSTVFGANPDDRQDSGKGETNITILSAAEFVLEIDDLRHDRSLALTLWDEEGLSNRMPIRLEFGVLADTPPVITSRLRGIGTAVTPSALVPVQGEVGDDHGIAEVFFRYEVIGGGAPNDSTNPDADDSGTSPKNDGTIPIAASIGRRAFPIDSVFPVEVFALQPGDRLTFSVEAKDNFHLPGMEQVGQTGSGDRRVLEIVTPEQLKMMLDVREITLRQRFEALIEDVKRTNQLLNDFPLEPEELPEEERPVLDDNAEPVVETELARQIREQRNIERLQKRLVRPEHASGGVYQMTRVLRDTQKETHEIRSLREEFRHIREELFNNRLLTEEIARRLDERILFPLDELIDRDFAAVDSELLELKRLLEHREQSTQMLTSVQRDTASRRFAELLVKMETIRNSMLSMESFSEAVELLRTILKQQEKLREEAQSEKKKGLRELLE